MDKNQKVIKNIFVVLTYRNYEDLQDFIDSVNDRVKNYKIIVVNSFFDDDSMEIIKNIALSNNCEFLNIPNKGYSFGNNVGVRYALENFRFEHLVISNADIIVQNFDTSQLEQGNIYCGELITLRGNNQNPMIIYDNKISDWLIYKGYKKIKSFF
ncbi:glycosyltransferase family 2 protein [Streptococcus massiliensis]|uniref:glycosyltransferase family 2 protein n=1 Tax=Streptococcus massiliensis TaxID=313439 RepID=UPI0003489DD9|nr:glycosyltransferase [Streptococcus massiliensis]